MLTIYVASVMLWGVLSRWLLWRLPIPLDQPAVCDLIFRPAAVQAFLLGAIMHILCNGEGQKPLAASSFQTRLTGLFLTFSRLAHVLCGLLHHF